jgi:hypothetical protein
MNLSEILVNLGLKVGPQQLTDGTLNALRSGKTGEGIFGQAHGKYYEAASRGKMFYSHIVGQTMTAPHTTCVGNILWNPTGSGVNLSMLEWSANVIVASSTVTGLSLCYGVQAIVPSTVTTVATTMGNCLLGALGGYNGAAKGYAAATLLVTPTVIWPLIENFAALGDKGMGVYSGGFGGVPIVPPGYYICIQTLGANAASAGVTSGLIWEEVPII